MLIETLDYSVTIDGVCINAFVNANPETLGFADYSSAEAWVNGETHITPVYGADPYLDKVESLINEGFIADHYMFSNGELVEAISEFERWDWTPEEGYILWDKSEPAIRPNRKQRRAKRRVQNHAHKLSDRKHGKRQAERRKNPSRKLYIETENCDHCMYKVVRGKVVPLKNWKQKKMEDWKQKRMEEATASQIL